MTRLPPTWRLTLIITAVAIVTAVSYWASAAGHPLFTPNPYGTEPL